DRNVTGVQTCALPIFGQRQQSAAVIEVDGIGGEFGFDDRQVGNRVSVRLPGGHVDDMDETGAAFDVTQELQTEPLAVGGSGDETGNVGDGVARVSCLDHAEVGRERGEGIVGDLRLRR